MASSPFQNTQDLDLPPSAGGGKASGCPGEAHREALRERLLGRQGVVPERGRKRRRAA